MRDQFGEHRCVKRAIDVGRADHDAGEPRLGRGRDVIGDHRGFARCVDEAPLARSGQQMNGQRGGRGGADERGCGSQPADGQCRAEFDPIRAPRNGGVDAIEILDAYLQRPDAWHDPRQALNSDGAVRTVVRPFGSVTA